MSGQASCTVDLNRPTLGEELNVVIEARSMELFATNLRRFEINGGVRVLAVHRPLTTPRVLTREHIEGCKIDDLEALCRIGWDLAGAFRSESKPDC
jgi:predicted unusual protein kinase regulating ubiquinone biosynthesis (AarF/ABC1/UbiB family)